MAGCDQRVQGAWSIGLTACRQAFSVAK
jgi:hypothetical protein